MEQNTKYLDLVWMIGMDKNDPLAVHWGMLCWRRIAFWPKLNLSGELWTGQTIVPRLELQSLVKTDKVLKMREKKKKNGFFIKLGDVIC